MDKTLFDNIGEQYVKASETFNWRNTNRPTSVALRGI